MSKSDTLRREYESAGNRYPGDAAAARRYLQLAQTCKQTALELDPGLALDERPVTARKAAPMALDAATEEAIIQRALRTARKSATIQSTSRKVACMRTPHSFDADALFQRGGFSSASARRGVSRRHALDADPDHAAALQHLGRARDHIVSARAGTSDFDPDRLAGYFSAAMDCMRGGAEDTISGMSPEDEHESYKERGYTDRELNGRDRRRAKDAGAETQAGAVVKTGSREIDHRKDFNSNGQGGADCALALDVDALLQR